MTTTDLGNLVYGQPHATRALERAIDHGHLSHAYLFHGPAMVGKSTLAAAFARALLCDADHRPCGECRSCVDCERGAHPDYRVVPAPNYDASPRRRISPGRIGSIGIDQIRELRMDSVLAPARSRWRVYAILDADRLTTEAMNAILKTLEEPPAHVVLILTAERIDALLPTIVSRCQLVRFGAVPRDMLASTLVGRLHVDEGRAYQLSCISRGRIGWAILALSEPAISEARDDALDRLRGLLRDGTIGRLEAASRLADRYGRDREDVLAVLETWVGWWRDAILVSAGAGEMIANVDREADLTEVGRRLSALDLRVATNAISAAVDNLAANVNPRMAFEHMVLTLPDPSSGRL